MFVPHLRHLLAAVTLISLLASCAGGSSTTPLASQQNQSHVQKLITACPCLYVADIGNASVTVYAEGATGDATPIQTISGSYTGLAYPIDVAVDASRDIYVANNRNSTATVYSAGTTGNVAPIQTIAGSMTGVFDPYGIALNPLNGNIYVANSSNGRNGGTVTIYPPGSSGNIAPIGIIKGKRTGLDNPGEVLLGGTGKIYVPNLFGSSNFLGSVTVYRAGATRGVPPIQTIGGSNTGLDYPLQVALDSTAKIYVVNAGDDSVTVYAPRANGNVAPIRTIEGHKTQLHDPDGIALDASGNIYVANGYLSSKRGTITIYAAGARGNATPINIISGSNTGLHGPRGIAIR
ncbi:MAG: NHL repeat-containing protein [Candidatus Cybelea sp.]